VHTPGDTVDDRIDTALGFGAEFGGGLKRERVVEDTRQDLGATQIDADEVFCFGAGLGHNRYRRP